MRCDCKKCRRPAYAEVYPGNASWSYLCKKHYKEEYKKHGNKYMWCELSIWERVKVFLTPNFWWLYI